jgi:hypothetical protein
MLDIANLCNDGCGDDLSHYLKNTLWTAFFLAQWLQVRVLPYSPSGHDF